LGAIKASVAGDRRGRTADRQKSIAGRADRSCPDVLRDDRAAVPAQLLQVGVVLWGGRRVSFTVARFHIQRASADQGVHLGRAQGHFQAVAVGATKARGHHREGDGRRLIACGVTGLGHPIAELAHRRGPYPVVDVGVFGRTVFANVADHATAE